MTTAISAIGKSNQYTRTDLALDYLREHIFTNQVKLWLFSVCVFNGISVTVKKVECGIVTYIVSTNAVELLLK